MSTLSAAESIGLNRDSLLCCKVNCPCHGAWAVRAYSASFGIRPPSPPPTPGLRRDKQARSYGTRRASPTRGMTNGRAGLCGLFAAREPRVPSPTVLRTRPERRRIAALQTAHTATCHGGCSLSLNPLIAQSLNHSPPPVFRAGSWRGGRRGRCRDRPRLGRCVWRSPRRAPGCGR